VSFTAACDGNMELKGGIEFCGFLGVQTLTERGCVSKKNESPDNRQQIHITVVVMIDLRVV